MAALVERSPDVLATVPDGDHSRATRWSSSADGSRSSETFRARRLGHGDVGRHATRISRPAPLHLRAGAAAGARAGRRRAAVLGAWRGTRGGGNRPPRARRSGARRAVRRDGGLPAHAAAVSRLARARVRARRRAGVLRSRHAPARSGRPRVRRAAVVCGRRLVGETIRRVSVARTGAAQIGASPSTASVDSRSASTAGSRRVVRPTDEVFRGRDDDDDPERGCRTPRRIDPDSDDEAVVAGTLRSPWKWEELIVESAVVGGRTRADGEARWRRRLDGLAADFGYRLRELRRDEPESPRIARFERDLRNLQHLRHFALPIIGELAGWPERAAWGEWLDRFARWRRARSARPTRVLQTLADLRPMAGVGPVALEEARDVLHDRLVTLDWEPPARRYGRLFVGTPHQARGRRFRVVFVPGLAERVVPQRPREDPLLLDDRRRALDPALVRQEARGTRRAAAAEDRDRRGERAVVSFVSAARRRRDAGARAVVLRARRDARDHRPRAGPSRAGLGSGGGRRRQPRPGRRRAIPIARSTISSTISPCSSRCSTRAATGAVRRALGEGPRPLHARSQSGAAALGHQPMGERRGAWSPSDGLIRVSPGTARAARRASSRAARAYSLSALQRFATCPYQFLLATIYRLEPWDEPEPIVRMDPLTRGSLFHKVQAEFFRAMKADGALPITPRRRARRRSTTLDAVLDRVAGEVRGERWRPPSTASGATRSTNCAATSASGSRSIADEPAGCPSTSSSASA